MNRTEWARDFWKTAMRLYHNDVGEGERDFLLGQLFDAVESSKLESVASHLSVVQRQLEEAVRCRTDADLQLSSVTRKGNELCGSYGSLLMLLHDIKRSYGGLLDAKIEARIAEAIGVSQSETRKHEYFCVRCRTVVPENAPCPKCEVTQKREGLSDALKRAEECRPHDFGDVRPERRAVCRKCGCVV